LGEIGLIEIKHRSETGASPYIFATMPPIKERQRILYKLILTD
jgi:hypothetical protein